MVLTPLLHTYTKIVLTLSKNQLNENENKANYGSLLLLHCVCVLREYGGGLSRASKFALLSIVAGWEGDGTRVCNC